jgi:hypothetical protein
MKEKLLQNNKDIYGLFIRKMFKINIITNE